MTSCKTDFLCTLPANRKTNKWKPTTTKKGLEHSFSVRFYTKAPKKRQPLKVYLNYRNFLHSMLSPEFPKFSVECSLSKFSSFWRDFWRKLCLENLALFIHISKFPKMLKDWKAAIFSRAWNYLNVFFVLGIVSMFHKLVTNQNSIIYLSRSTFTFFNYLSLYGMNLMLMILDPVSRAQQFRERLSEKMCTRQSRKGGLINTLFLTFVAFH